MSIYTINGTELLSAFDYQGNALSQAYDVNGVQVFSAEEPEEPFVKTTLAYDTNWFINSAWLANAEIQRDAIKAIYQQSEDAIPFFIQTDGHGRYNEGNKGCHNLAEPVMRYIPNIQLGDYASYYNDGANPANHARTSAGITNYLTVMGNHEFMRSSTSDPIADMTLMVPSYTSPGGILGSQTEGYHKVLDDKYNVKWLIGQPHIPDDSNSSGFVTKFTTDQWQWFIDELEADDGYDVIVLNHEPFGGTYYRVATGEYITYEGQGGKIDLAPILSARKAKTAGTFTDPDGVTYNYDFTNCDSDMLCVMHGHIHKIEYMTKEGLGYPGFIGRDMTNDGDCAYGIIDRAGGKMYIYCFGKSYANEPIILDL
jgi:hypothetical protein